MSRRQSALLVAALLAAPCLTFAGPSTDLDTYALFAAKKLTAKGITLLGGNIGVNDGSLFVHDYLDAPGSDVAADQVNVPTTASCSQQFANTSSKASPNCGVAGGTPVPIVQDIAATCGFPQQFPACDPATPVIVPPGGTLALPSGVYGDLVVARGADLTLVGGGYVFCSVKVSRAARLEAQAPVEIDVTGRIAIGGSATFGPAPGSGLTPADLRLFSDGISVHFSRQSQVQARLCAPNASLRLTQGGSHMGTFIANAIGTEHISVDLPASDPPCGDIGDGFCGGSCPPGRFCGDFDGCRCVARDQ